MDKLYNIAFLSIAFLSIIILALPRDCVSQVVIHPVQIYHTDGPPAAGIGLFLGSINFPLRAKISSPYYPFPSDSQIAGNFDYTILSLQLTWPPGQREEYMGDNVIKAGRIISELSAYFGNGSSLNVSLLTGAKFGYGWTLGKDASFNLLNELSLGAIAYGDPFGMIDYETPMLSDNFGGLNFCDRAGSTAQFEFSQKFDLDITRDQFRFIPSGAAAWRVLTSEILTIGTMYLTDFIIGIATSKVVPIIPIVNFAVNSSILYKLYDFKLRNASYPFQSPGALGMDYYKFGFSFKI
jgi:hypothetical protein